MRQAPNKRLGKHVGIEDGEGKWQFAQGRAIECAKLLMWRDGGLLMSMNATGSGLYLDLGDKFRDVWTKPGETQGGRRQNRRIRKKGEGGVEHEDVGVERTPDGGAALEKARGRPVWMKWRWRGRGFRDFPCWSGKLAVLSLCL